MLDATQCNVRRFCRSDRVKVQTRTRGPRVNEPDTPSLSLSFDRGIVKKKGGGWSSGDNGDSGGGALMEYHRKGKKRVGSSTEAQREPSPAHSDAHTPRDDSTSGHQFAQLGGGAQTPPWQTPPVDQQTILLTTMQTLTSLVQSMVSNQRSNASPSGDTTVPLKEKASAMPEEDKVNYGTYLLKGVAMDWSQSTLELRYAGQPSSSWKQFIDSFFNSYYPVHATEKKMQEFLDLQQNQMSLEEYITRYRHLERIAHTCTLQMELDQASLCVVKVLTSRPHDLDEAVTMARCIEEDWARTQKDHHKKAGQHSQGGRTQIKRQHFAGRTRPYER
ncbi:hypothetical protein EJ110_NYTH13782 [Nymphaea thermarum]|nr:hypothetical protein EJ110_NYTH13782 [Nymphaea thermarum]